MFDSEVGKNSSSVDVRRRAFLGFSVSAIAGAVVVAAKAEPNRSGDAEGRSGRGYDCPVLRFRTAAAEGSCFQSGKSDQEWRQQLSANAFDITRHADTEFAFSGKYWNLHDKGLYRCICCDNALFSSETKFESGTGWPVSGSRLRRRMSATSTTPVLVWRGPPWPARCAMRIWACLR